MYMGAMQDELYCMWLHKGQPQGYNVTAEEKWGHYLVEYRNYVKLFHSWAVWKQDAAHKKISGVTREILFFLLFLSVHCNTSRWRRVDDKKRGMRERFQLAA